MNAEATFADPTNYAVTITLSGTLGQFETLAGHLRADKPVPHYAARVLLEQISDVSRQLRAKVRAETSEDQP